MIKSPLYLDIYSLYVDKVNNVKGIAKMGDGYSVIELCKYFTCNIMFK